MLIDQAYREMASCLQNITLMRQIFKKRTAFVAFMAAVYCFTLLQIASTAQGDQSDKSASQPEAVKSFEKRVKEYVKLREQIEEKMPKLSKEAKPEEIEAHKKSFQEAVRAARTTPKPVPLRPRPTRTPALKYSSGGLLVVDIR